MTQANEHIAIAALSLPPEERVELAERLLGSLESPEQREIDAAWAAEAERRIDQLDAGKGAVIAGDELMSRLATRCK